MLGNCGDIPLIHDTVPVNIQHCGRGMAGLELPRQGEGVENVDTAVVVDVLARKTVSAEGIDAGALEQQQRQQTEANADACPPQDPEGWSPLPGLWPQLRSGCPQNCVIDCCRNEGNAIGQRFQGRYEPLRRRQVCFILVFQPIHVPNR